MTPHSWIKGAVGSAGPLLSLTALALFVFTHGPAPAAPKPAYFITDLGAAPPTYPLSYGQAINNANQVAGTATDTAGGSSERLSCMTGRTWTRSARSAPAAATARASA